MTKEYMANVPQYHNPDLAVHTIKVEQLEGMPYPWLVTWESLDGSHRRTFQFFNNVSHFIEGELLA